MRVFLEKHWRRPLGAQGPAPARFSAVERSLAPRSCGTCHPAQLADWATSLHARSMGPGVTGQLPDLARTDPASARLCLTCHAPLAEQQPDIETSTGARPNADFDPALQKQGLVCAACHVRRHQRFGPPRRDGSTAPSAPNQSLPHGGVTRTAAFVRSEFCASCHQFGADGFALNGKPLENTYEEWKASPAARRGTQCQDCHMPDRRHLWRGIHDPETVKGGVEILLTTDRPRYRPGEQVRATLTVTNTNVGHDFPTYVTPQVVVRAALVDGAGRIIGASVQDRTIGRSVPLDLSREIADTRIAPGARLVFEYRRPLDRAGLRLVVTVTVFPDHFYTRLFEALVSSGAGAGAPDIQRALEASRSSAFEIFRREIPLT